MKDQSKACAVNLNRNHTTCFVVVAVLTKRSRDLVPAETLVQTHTVKHCVTRRILPQEMVCLRSKKPHEVRHSPVATIHPLIRLMWRLDYRSIFKMDPDQRIEENPQSMQNVCQTTRLKKVLVPLKRNLLVNPQVIRIHQSFALDFGHEGIDKKDDQNI
ncbi:hypothetical protein J6590_105259, partial [Homalodisca vitripennis]